MSSNGPVSLQPIAVSFKEEGRCQLSSGPTGEKQVEIPQCVLLLLGDCLHLIMCPRPSCRLRHHVIHFFLIFHLTLVFTVDPSRISPTLALLNLCTRHLELCPTPQHVARHQLNPTLCSAQPAGSIELLNAPAPASFSISQWRLVVIEG